MRIVQSGLTKRDLLYPNDLCFEAGAYQAELMRL